MKGTLKMAKPNLIKCPHCDFTVPTGADEVPRMTKHIIMKHKPVDTHRSGTGSGTSTGTSTVPKKGKHE